MAEPTLPAPTAGLALDLHDVSKKFRLDTSPSGSIKDIVTGFHRSKPKEFWAVKGVDMAIPRGSMAGIIGRNGSGKSTLLRMMCGVYRPSTGHIDVHGRVTALLELGAGFHADLSGRENIYMNAAVMGIARDKVDEVVDDIVALADIGQFIENPVNIYSSGMRARLGFAVSVFLDPEILLADEIIAVGDVGFAKQCLDHLRRMRSEGVTIVLVSHNLGIMEQMCDQILWLHEGEPQVTGPSRDVIRDFRDFMTGASGLPEFQDHFDTNNPLTHLEATSEDGVVMGYTGAPLTLRAAYRFEQPVVDARLRLRLHHQDGPMFLGSGNDRIIDGPLEGKGTLRYDIPTLPVGPGQYAVELQVLSGEPGPDEKIVASRRCPLPIRPLPELAVKTVVDLDGAWELGTAATSLDTPTTPDDHSVPPNG